MRLWHKDLIDVLPKQQLLGQWRECCCIARNIAVNGTPNHILVNKIMDYPIEHFISYSFKVHSELISRGYNCNFERFINWIDGNYEKHIINNKEMFKDWHNSRYFIQCFHNLEEKYDCGGITSEEFDLILERYHQAMQEIVMRFYERRKTWSGY